MTLTLPDIPHSLRERLLMRHCNQRSLEQEAVVFETVMANKSDERVAEIDRIIAEAEAERSRMPRFISDKEITAAIREGRA